MLGPELERRNLFQFYQQSAVAGKVEEVNANTDAAMPEKVTKVAGAVSAVQQVLTLGERRNLASELNVGAAVALDAKVGFQVRKDLVLF